MSKRTAEQTLRDELEARIGRVIAAEKREAKAQERLRDSLRDRERALRALENARDDASRAKAALEAFTDDASGDLPALIDQARERAATTGTHDPTEAATA